MKRAEKTVSAARATGKTADRAGAHPAQPGNASWPPGTPERCDVCGAKVTCRPTDPRQPWCPRCHADAVTLSVRMHTAPDDARDLLGLVRVLVPAVEGVADMTLRDGDPAAPLAAQVKAAAVALADLCEQLPAALAVKPGRPLPGWQVRRDVERALIRRAQGQN